MITVTDRFIVQEIPTSGLKTGSYLATCRDCGGWQAGDSYADAALFIDTHPCLVIRNRLVYPGGTIDQAKS